jgi:hypothetical protein
MYSLDSDLRLSSFNAEYEADRVTREQFDDTLGFAAAVPSVLQLQSPEATRAGSNSFKVESIATPSPLPPPSSDDLDGPTPMSPMSASYFSPASSPTSAALTAYQQIVKRTVSGQRAPEYARIRTAGPALPSMLTVTITPDTSAALRRPETAP